MANGSVLSRGIHALQDNQKGSFLYGVKQLLQIVEALDRFVEFGLRFMVVIMTKRIGGIVFRELDLLVRRDHQFADEIQANGS
jgi:hypothetical protein